MGGGVKKSRKWCKIIFEQPLRELHIILVPGRLVVCGIDTSYAMGNVQEEAVPKYLVALVSMS